jgi:integrase
VGFFENNLTNDLSIDYLLPLLENEEMMKGTIRVREKCPICGGPFEYVNKKLGYICKPCKTIPTRFYIDIFYQGKRVRLFSDKTGQVLDSYARALNILSSINYEIKDHEFDPSNYVQAELQQFWVTTLLDRFLSHKLTSIAPSYKKDYERMVGKAKDFFKNKDVREIRKIDIVNFKEHLEGKSSLRGKSIKNILDVFKTFLMWCRFDLEIIGSVPAFPPVEVEAPGFRWLSAQDQISLLKHIPDEHKPLVIFLMLHGLRPGEARALRCKDISLAEESITVRATFSNGIYRERRKGRRPTPFTVPIHPEMFDFIRDRVRGNLPEAYVFVNPKTGRHYSETGLKLIWQAARKAAGLPETVRLYDATRHSLASQLVNAGTSLYTVSKLLGHSTTRMTEKYAHAHIESLRADIRKLSLRPRATVTEVALGEKSRQNYP